MPLLTPLQGELGSSIVTILYGIFWERWYVGRSSIAFNVYTWSVLLFTVDLELWVLAIFAIWIFIGYLLTHESGKGGFKQLFGCKVFGSLSLFLGGNEYLQLHIHGIWIFVGWAIVAAFVVWLGHKFGR